MTERYIPKVGDKFEAYEQGGIRHIGEQLITLIKGHKSRGSPFICNNVTAQQIETKDRRFRRDWYTFEKSDK